MCVKNRIRPDRHAVLSEPFGAPGFFTPQPAARITNISIGDALLALIGVRVAAPLMAGRVALATGGAPCSIPAFTLCWWSKPLWMTGG